MDPEIRIIKPGEQKEELGEFQWITALARLLDSRFIIPGTNIRFGLDPILSLFPILGDFVSYMFSGMLIYMMYNRGVSRKIVIKMVLNATLDAVIGVIPIVGSIFDVFYRANDRNIKLLKEHYLEDKHHGSGNGILIVIFIIACAIFLAASYGVWKVFQVIFP